MGKLLRSLYKTLYPRLSGSGIHRFSLMRKVDAQLRSRLGSKQAVAEGHRFLLDPDDCLRISIIGEYEPDTTQLAKREIRAGDVVVDVGAHIGYFTLLFARLVGERGRVYAFEPDPDNFALLQANVEANGYTNVVLEAMAVSEEVGTVRLYRSEDNPADHRIYDSQENRPYVEVPATSLNAYFAERSPRVDLVKIDVQGAEGAVVRGASQLLARNPSLELIVEFSPACLQSAGFSPLRFLELLDERGFQLHPILGGPDDLAPSGVDKLAEFYTPERKNFANLFCSKLHAE